MFHDYMFHVKHTMIDVYSGFKNAQIFLMRVFAIVQVISDFLTMQSQ